jgi:hypothetical protein
MPAEALIGLFTEVRKKFHSKAHKKCNFLVEITLRACLQVNDQVISALAKPKLQRLDLTMCVSITDNALGILQVCKNLDRIDLQVTEFFIVSNILWGCPLISDVGLAFLAKFAKYLQKLDLGRCMGISDIGVKEILENCPFITKMNLQSIDGITDKTLAEIDKVASSGAYMKVYLAECTNVSKNIFFLTFFRWIKIFVENSNCGTKI